MTTKQRIKNGTLQTRSASYDETAGTVEIIYSTGARAEQMAADGTTYLEELVISPDAIVSDALDQGAVHLIYDHMPYGLPAGRVTDHRIENGVAVATVLLSTSGEVAGVVSDIRAGVIQSVSVGYEVLETETVFDGEQSVVRVTKWKPVEISLTVLPADPGARIRSKKTKPAAVRRRIVRNAIQKGPPMKGKLQPRATTRAQAKAPRRRTAAEVATEVAEEVIDEELIDVAVDAVIEEVDVDVAVTDAELAVEEAVVEAVEVAVEEVIAEIEEEEEGTDETAAADTAATPADAAASERRRSASILTMSTRHGLSADFASRHIAAGTPASRVRSAIVQAVAGRSTAPIRTVAARARTNQVNHARRHAEAAVYGLLSGRSMSENDAGRYRSMGVLDIARSTLGSAANGRSNREVIAMATRSGAHSSSDFSFTSVVGGAIDRRVREIFAGLEMPLAPLVRQTLVNDFRPVDTYSIGGFPELREVVEGAEYEAGSIITEAGTFSIKKFGRVLSLTFEAITNDDLRMLDTAIRGTAAKGVSLRNKQIRAAFSAKLADGKALFHATRGNLLTDALDVEGLSKARAALRKVKDIDGDPMGLTPRYLVVGPDLETDAQRLISPITAAVTGEVNPFSSNLELIVDPLLDGTEWIVAGDPAYGDAIELADLRGYEGVQVEEVPNHLSDGITWRARTFAAAHPTGWRGFVKSSGG